MNNWKVNHRLRLMACFALGAGLGITAACKKPAPADSSKESAATEQLAMPSSRPADSESAAVPVGKDPRMERALDERYAANPSKKEEMRQTMNELDARFSAEDRLAEINRRTMVTPAPPDFKPGQSARKIQLKLILEKQKIRAGEYPRFRLEMTNVGREAIDYQETSPSIFVKGGRLVDSSTILFFLTDSRNKRAELLPPVFTPRSASGLPAEKRIESPPSGLSEAELEKWFAETNAMGQAHATFKVKLLPGETLHSIGDDDSPIENFKSLWAEGGFKKPGKYQLQVELDDRPRPLSKGYIEASLRSGSTLEEIHRDHSRWMRSALGPVSSNAAILEVAQ